MAAALQSLEEALARLLADCEPAVRVVSLPLSDALGRILAEDFTARIDVPPWDNSAMDGYAVDHGSAGATLPLSQRIAAGDVPQALAAGTAARIFTGAPIPAAADAVVMQEDVLSLENDTVQLPAAITPGQHIRRRGQDCRSGERLLRRGRRLRPQDLGLIASQGIAEVAVYQPLRVAILSTGSELQEPGTSPLAAGAIYNSNRPMLAGLLAGLGCSVVDLGIVEDTYEATCEALRRAAEQADLVLSSGGVSVGEADYVRDAVEALGAIDLWRIAIKPGKPFAKGHIGGTPFVGVPGNPSSAFVTFLLLARPYIMALQGRHESARESITVRCAFSVTRPGSRREFLRVSRVQKDGELWAEAYGNQSSGVLTSVSASDALAVIPEGETLAPGDPVQLLPLDALLF